MCIRDSYLGPYILARGILSIKEIKRSTLPINKYGGNFDDFLLSIPTYLRRCLIVTYVRNL